MTALLGVLIALSGVGAAQPSPVADKAVKATAAYPRYADMLAKIKEWKRRYPTLVHETTLGKTAEGRPIPLLRLSDDAAPNLAEPGVMIAAGIHARESQPPVCLLWLTDELLAGYGKEERLTKLLKERQIYFVPVLNVDGKLYDETAKPPRPGRDWRKNRRALPGGSGRVGVDLNRNFPVRWGGFRETDTLWNDRTDRPSGNIYEGPAPLSEPESKALADFFAAHAGDVRLFVDFHSPLRKVLFPNYLYGADADRYQELADGIRSRQKDRPYAATVIKRDAEPPAGSRAGNTGLSYSYAYYVHGIYGFNIEIGLNDPKADADTSGDLIGRHYPPLRTVRAEYEANIREPLLYLLDAAGSLPAPTLKPVPALQNGQPARWVNWDKPPLPGATVAFNPNVEDAAGFAVLTSDSPSVVVQSELRALPIRTGFTLQIAADAEPGTNFTLSLTSWDAARNRSVRSYQMRVMSEEVWRKAGEPHDSTPKDEKKK